LTADDLRLVDVLINAHATAVRETACLTTALRRALEAGDRAAFEISMNGLKQGRLRCMAHKLAIRVVERTLIDLRGGGDNKSAPFTGWYAEPLEDVNMDLGLLSDEF
jgi:hypothetical protein